MLWVRSGLEGQRPLADDALLLKTKESTQFILKTLYLYLIENIFLIKFSEEFNYSFNYLISYYNK